MIHPRQQSSPETTSPLFQKRLDEHGYVNGQNLTIEYPASFAVTFEAANFPPWALASGSRRHPPRQRSHLGMDRRSVQQE
jgi:hypothetical protein